MDTLQRLNNDYPCDKRKGYSKSGCGSCKGSGKGGKIQCGLHNYPVPAYECEECSYQERIGRSRALKKKKEK